MMKRAVGIVGVLSVGLLAQASSTRKVAPCEHPEQYSRPGPGIVSNPPLRVWRVFGRAIVEARDRVIPVDQVGGACISLFTDEGHRFVASTTTDKYGRFKFSPVPPGIYRLVARATGFCTGNTRVEVVASSEGKTKVGLLVHIRVPNVDDCSYSDYDRVPKRNDK